MSALVAFRRFVARACVVPLVAALPGIARACAVCNAGGSPANRFAFFLSTMVLSLLPLGMFLACGLWLRSRLRQKPRAGVAEPERPSGGVTAIAVSGAPPSGG